MNRKILLAALALTLSLNAVACNGIRPDKDPETTPETEETKALRRDIGEMLIVGFRGQYISDTSHIYRDISQHHIGGVILFEYDATTNQRKRNIASPSQVRKLCRQLQKANTDSLPILIGIDQEGGAVTRLRKAYGFPYFASAKASAEAGPDSVRHYARITANTLRSLGINLNFAPCVDVDINPDCPIIGKLGRSFSSDPAHVASSARIWIEEQRKAGVISCLKHFPGHGSASGDTHLGLVDVTDTWKDQELQPYETLIKEGHVDMVMTAHVIQRNLDTMPASLSQKITTGLLRQKLGFNGIVITDDMAMGAIVTQYGLEEAIMLAISAGADLLCLSNNGKDYNDEIVPQTIDIILKLVADGSLSADRIHESANRIRALKAKTARPAKPRTTNEYQYITD